MQSRCSTIYVKRNGEYSGLVWFYYDFEANGVSDEKRDTLLFETFFKQ